MMEEFHFLQSYDISLYNAMNAEFNRQQHNIELIASENYVSKEVMLCQGSFLTNKYAEGYPSKRYYGGCEYVDIVENLAIDRVKRLFNCDYANVQPHSGSQANYAAIASICKPYDKILGMDIAAGGHLTHGATVNFSGKVYHSFGYGVNPETGYIDYDEVLKIAKLVRPKVIIAGASAYSREIDFAKFRAIADEVKAYLISDIAHIAGLIVAGEHVSPFPHSHIVTSTTHKTLRGPRGGIILTNDEELAKKIDFALFPGSQGGPLMHVVAAKAVAFKEAAEDEFKAYQKQIVKNAKAFCATLQKLGYNIVSGGTDNHLFLVDLSSHNVTGKDVQNGLDKVHITLNKNMIPFDKHSPFITSGIRIGTPAITTRGMVESDMEVIAGLIDKYIVGLRDSKLSSGEIESEIVSSVRELSNKYPIYK